MVSVQAVEVGQFLAEGNFLAEDGLKLTSISNERNL